MFSESEDSISSFFDINKILFVILFIIIIAVIVYVYRSVSSVRLEISKISTGTTNNDTLMNTIVKTEENIGKTNAKLDAFIKYIVGMQQGQQGQQSQQSQQEKSKLQTKMKSESKSKSEQQIVDDDDDDEDEIIDDEE